MPYRKTIRVGGKRISHYFRTKEAADRWYRKMRDQKEALRAGVELPAEEILLEDYAKRFLARRLKIKDHNVWINDEQRIRDYILPKFGKRLLSSINTPEWKRFLEEIVTELGRSKATSNRVRAVASKLYNEALEENPPLARTNPITRAKPFNERRARIKKIKDNFLRSSDDMLRYLTEARKREPGYFIYMMIKFNTGLRTGQAVPIQWKDIDWNDRLIRVERTYQSSNNTLKKGSKGWSEDEEYVVGLNDALFKALQWWKSESEFSRPTDFVASQEDGKHFYSWHLRRRHRNILREMNRPECPKCGKAMKDVLPSRYNKSGYGCTSCNVFKSRKETRANPIRITEHGLRHTYATHYLERGGSTDDLQKILGHKQASTTQIYTHIIPKTMNVKANVLSIELDDSLSPQCHQKQAEGETDDSALLH